MNAHSFIIFPTKFHQTQEKINMLNIGKAAVLGAGTMGAGIAAHLANAGIPTLLLDIAPPEADAKDKNQIVKSLFEAAKKLKPAPFMLAENANLITLGNFTD